MDPRPHESTETQPVEDTREVLTFRQVELIEVEPSADRVVCTFFSATGARERGRQPIKSPVHWFRGELSRQDPLVELVLDGGFYVHSEFGPRGMELGDAVVSGRLVQHDRLVFPERYWLDNVKVVGWKA